jgi:hypothetical protein
MVDSSNNKTVAMKGAYFYEERREGFSREEAVGSSNRPGSLVIYTAVFE